jgi:hypothetical protein
MMQGGGRRTGPGSTRGGLSDTSFPDPHRDLAGPRTQGDEFDVDTGRLGGLERRAEPGDIHGGWVWTQDHQVRIADLNEQLTVAHVAAINLATDHDHTHVDGSPGRAWLGPGPDRHRSIASRCRHAKGDSFWNPSGIEGGVGQAADAIAAHLCLSTIGVPESEAEAGFLAGLLGAGLFGSSDIQTGAKNQPVSPDTCVAVAQSPRHRSVSCGGARFIAVGQEDEEIIAQAVQLGENQLAASRTGPEHLAGWG